MSKKIVKLAIIRSDNDSPCPFGLGVPFGCQKVGALIARMAPVDVLGEDATDEERKEIADANRHLLMWLLSEESGGRCRYASKVFEDKDAVECGWETDVSGEQGDGALRGSPFYYKHFSGTGLDGLYSYPLGHYTDNSIDKGIYNNNGFYSIEASKKEEDDEA